MHSVPKLTVSHCYEKQIYLLRQICNELSFYTVPPQNTQTQNTQAQNTQAQNTQCLKIPNIETTIPIK